MSLCFSKNIGVVLLFVVDVTAKGHQCQGIGMASGWENSVHSDNT